MKARVKWVEDRTFVGEAASRTRLRMGRGERLMLLLVVGFPAADARVPDIVRKPLDQVTTWR